MNNSIFVIKPYKWEGLWVFDDANVGLVKEPFVGGADTMIDVATAHIANADKGFLAIFSAGFSPMLKSSSNGPGRMAAAMSIAGRTRTWRAGCARHCFATSQSRRRSCTSK